jgi:hypothetical protein
VHAAVGDQPHEVQAMRRPTDFADDLEQYRVAKEAAVADRHGDPHEVLVRDPSGAQILVADLAVAHLARRQADGLTGRVQQAMRVGGQQLIQHRQAGEKDRVAVSTSGLGVLVLDAPAVAHDQHERTRHRLSILARIVSSRPLMMTASVQTKPAQ